MVLPLISYSTLYIYLPLFNYTNRLYSTNIFNLLSETCEAHIRAYNKHLFTVVYCSNAWENHFNIYIINLKEPESCPIFFYFCFCSLSAKSLIKDRSSLLRILGFHLGITCLNNATSGTYFIL